jgi:hypothetical protein
VPALEPLVGIRVVASPDALDRAVWAGDEVTVLRFAPDEAFAIGASAVDVGDINALVEPEAGFVGARLAAVDAEHVVAHTDWSIPIQPGILAQGKVAGVPAKVRTGEPALLVTQAAYADELARRLGW